MTYTRGMTKIQPPSPPFIKARHFGGRQVPKAIVIHATVSPDNPGRARSIANWWAGPTSPVTSAHYIRDPHETIQCVGDHTVAFHCGSNANCIGYEFCDEQTGPASRWDDANSRAILAGAAKDIARLCLAYGIEPKRPTIRELKVKGKHGIYGHNDSRLAFGGTTHTDPRDFPWARFIGLVKLEIAALQAPSIVQPPKEHVAVKRSPLTRLMSQNIKAKPLMAQANVKADVVRTGSQGELIGWQEIGPRRYKEAVMALDADAWQHYVARPNDEGYNSPISWRRDRFIALEKGAFLLNQSTQVSSTRWVTWVILRERSTGLKVLVTNAHYVVRAYNGRVDPAIKRVYDKAAEHHRAFILGKMRENPGMAVVGLGDYNRAVNKGNPVGPRLHGRVVRDTTPKNSIDRVWVCNSKNGNGRIKVTDQKTLWGRNSDHPGRRATVEFRRRGRAK